MSLHPSKRRAEVEIATVVDKLALCGGRRLCSPVEEGVRMTAVVHAPLGIPTRENENPSRTGVMSSVNDARHPGSNPS
jgi:hypothetical protein